MLAKRARRWVDLGTGCCEHVGCWGLVAKGASSLLYTGVENSPLNLYFSVDVN